VRRLEVTFLRKPLSVGIHVAVRRLDSHTPSEAVERWHPSHREGAGQSHAFGIISFSLFLSFFPFSRGSWGGFGRAPGQVPFYLADSLAILIVGFAGSQQAMSDFASLGAPLNNIRGTTILYTYQFDKRIAIINFSLSRVFISRRSITL
jgi:hypothetical protein